MRTMLRGKIHRATVTGADIHYEGSIAIDPDLLEASDMIENEQTHVFDIENGERLVTYIIEGERGSGEVSLNGAAARNVAIGDKVIICTFAAISDEEAKTHKPSLILVDENNKIAKRY